MNKSITKPNVLGSALKGLRPPKPTEQVKNVLLTAASKSPIGVMFRLDPQDHEIVSDYARDKQMSMQELLEFAINVVRSSEGLAPIQGRPRSKTRIKRIL